jgi:putative nucleotidyltransferase with HDIG domain
MARRSSPGYRADRGVFDWTLVMAQHGLYVCPNPTTTETMTKAETNDRGAVKKIRIEQLQAGMFVHDLNCGWMDHPFLSSQFLVRDGGDIAKITKLGIHELYIDTARGADVADAIPRDEVRRNIGEQLEAIAREVERPVPRVARDQEYARAKALHNEANLIVQNMVRDIRLGQQIEMEKLEPLVEDMIDSIFRSPDALLPLARLKDHDHYTFQHSVSVCALMIAFARGLSLDRAIIKEIAMGALLHDVGKAKVPDEILNKPAKLTEAEFTKMKSHVVQSIIILQHTPGITQVMLDVAGQHHERHDGTGYPNALKGNEISLYGKMGAIVDVYDALTSVRVYKKGMPATEALGKLLEWSSHHFDPEMVRLYIKSIGIYPTGSLVKLESGRLAIVLEQHADRLLQPHVLVVFNSKGQHYIKPEHIDLAAPGCTDRIVGHEDFDSWSIDPAKWLMPGL